MRDLPSLSSESSLVVSSFGFEGTGEEPPVLCSEVGTVASTSFKQQIHMSFKLETHEKSDDLLFNPVAASLAITVEPSQPETPICPFSSTAVMHSGYQAKVVSKREA